MFKKYLFILEKKFITLVIRKRGSILLYLFALLLISSSYFIPYLNLYINNLLIFFMVVSSFLLVFQISIQKIALLAISIFTLSMILFLVRDYDRAELLVNSAYGLVLISLFSNLLKLREKS